MGKYDNITKYLKYLNEDDFGKWSIDREGKGTFENPTHIPYVEYSEMVIHLEKDVCSLVEDNENRKINQYSEILEKNGIEWTSESMRNADVSQLDDQCLIALLIGVLRADRFCEGTLLSFFNDGSIKKWILRLKEIDDREK